MPTIQKRFLRTVDLVAEWDKFRARRIVWRERPRAPRTRDAFLEVIRQMINDEESIRYVSFCMDCSEPGLGGAMYTTSHSGQMVCVRCIRNYAVCESCSYYCRPNTRTIVLAGYRVCEPCRTTNFTYCSSCRGYYYNNEHRQHAHGSTCCTSPELTFTVRNDGHEPLANDTRTTVTIPAGTISDEGISRIVTEIQNYAYNAYYDTKITRSEKYLWDELSGDLAVLGKKWQAKDGNYTKRLSRHAHKTRKLKVPPGLLSAIGNICSDHSGAVDHRIEVTRELNQSARSFANGGSCWWESYASSRCALKTNGGFGIRAFDESGRVIGRVWAMPMKLTRAGGRDLTPTFETLDPAAYVLFNGYHTLNGYTGARVFSHMVGWTYRKIEFRCSPMYVNSGSGYLIAPEDLATRYTDGSLSLDLTAHSSLFEVERKIKEKISA